MSLEWYLRLAERWHPLGIGLAMLLVLGVFHFAGLLTVEGSTIEQHVSLRQLYGTEIMFVLLPTYMLAFLAYQGLHARATLERVSAYAPQATRDAVMNRVTHLHPYSWPFLVTGFAWGFYQNASFLFEGFENNSLVYFDFLFALGNCMVWTVVALHLSWRIPLSMAFSKLGAVLDFDVYQVHRVRPLARVATLDVLVVAGAIALMPLQALDLEFRWGNYGVGLAVAIPAAITLFLLPLVGPRRRIAESKLEELARVEALIDQHNRADVVGIEALASHMERLRSMPNWPIDIRLLTRVFIYGFIAPLAWVAAALVEQLVDSVTR